MTVATEEAPSPVTSFRCRRCPLTATHYHGSEFIVVRAVSPDEFFVDGGRVHCAEHGPLEPVTGFVVPLSGKAFMEAT